MVFLITPDLEKFANATFVYHVLNDKNKKYPPISSWQKQITENKKNKSKRVNPRFIKWLSLEKHRKTVICSIVKDAANPDVALAVSFSVLLEIILETVLESLEIHFKR